MAVMSKDGAEEQTDAEADIHRMEETLDVLFPKKLTEAIKSDSLPKKAIDGFTFLRPQNFFREVEFHVQNPETIKAVVIGENGLGDYLGLLLKKNSDYELAAKIWEFKHETGTVAPWKYWSL